MSDPAVRVTLPAGYAEIAGALLMDLLGPFQELGEGERRHLLFYPFRHGAGYVPDEVIRERLPAGLAAAVEIERVLVPGGWEESWREHFRPLTIGRLRISPPWDLPADRGGESPGDGAGAETGRPPSPSPASPPTPPDLLDLVLTPGLAFGTGLHPTTRGVLTLLQRRPAGGPLLDVGTGSGILAAAAARLGYDPIIAVDNDPQAVEAARGNLAANDLAVPVYCVEASELSGAWFEGATILANMTLEPVVALFDRLAGRASRHEPGVGRMLVAGILSGGQERSLDVPIEHAGLRVVSRLYEREWVSMDLTPD